MAAAEVLLQAALQQAAHRRPGYPRVASRQVGFAPTRRVSWPAEAVRMRAAWQRAGSVRWAAGHPSEGDFALLQSTIRSAARPLSTQSRTAAVVVSPIHPQCRNPSASLYKAKAEPPCRHSATSWLAAVKWPACRAAGMPTTGMPATPIVSAPHLNRVRKRCRTISYTICVVTVFNERVKRVALGAYGRLMYWRGRLRAHGAPNRGRGASTHPWGGFGSSIRGM